MRKKFRYRRRNGWKKIQDISSEMDGTKQEEDIVNKNILLMRDKIKNYKHKYETRKYIRELLKEVYT